MDPTEAGLVAAPDETGRGRQVGRPRTHLLQDPRRTPGTEQDLGTTGHLHRNRTDETLARAEATNVRRTSTEAITARPEAEAEPTKAGFRTAACQTEIFEPT